MSWGTKFSPLIRHSFASYQHFGESADECIYQIDVSFSRVCPVIDHEFRHNIIKLAVDPQTTLTMLWRNALSITGQTHEKLTSICFLR